jgi:hypothetical protein
VPVNKHFLGLICRPRRGESFEAISNPKCEDGFDGRVFRKCRLIHFVQCVCPAVVAELIACGLLLQQDSWQPSESKRPRVGSKDRPALYHIEAEWSENWYESCERPRQVIAAVEIEPNYGPLTQIQIDVRQTNKARKP